MDLSNDPATMEHLPGKMEALGRGRSRKRSKEKSVKKKLKEPFSHIAAGIIPFAAVASASPNAARYVGKSRSPSPIARAIAFAGRIGHAIAAGDKLKRSLSERDVYRRSESLSDFAESNQFSKSLPGPSALCEPDGDFETEVGYETVKEVQGKAFAPSRDSEGNGASPMAGRQPMPLPDGEDGERNAQRTDDFYAKVVKSGTVKSKIEKFQTKQDVADDSDDLTTVSEVDEETSSKVFVIKTKSKQQELYLEDTSDGPSDGEVFRLPLDAIRSQESEGIQFQTIEELENEDISARSKCGLRSPGSARSRGSSRDSASLPPLRSPGSLRDLENKRQLSRSQSPQDRVHTASPTAHDMGREAALRRLEELGFDGINNEFGLVLQNEDNKHGLRNRRRQLSYEDDVVLMAYEENFVESTTTFDEIDRGSIACEEERVSVAETRLDKQKKNAGRSQIRDVEEPLIQSAEMSNQQSSQELMLEELVDESASRWSYGSGADMGKLSAANLNESIRSKSLSPSKSRSQSETEFPNANGMTDGMNTVGKESQNSRNFQRSFGGAEMNASVCSGSPKNKSTSIDARQVYEKSGQSVKIPKRLIQSKTSGSVHSQNQIQKEIKEKQDAMMQTISTLEKKFENVAKTVVSDRRESEDQEAKLTLLRKLIKEEQHKYFDQQKILNEHQEKVLKSQRLASPRSPKQSRFASTPVSQHHVADETRNRPSSSLREIPDQFLILQNRAQTLQAERDALHDLNSSLQDENKALKRLALQADTGESSGIVFRKQNEELMDSNKNLKSLVHRLNIELGRYQAKYRPPRKEEVDGLSFPEEGPIPEWLVNMKYLSPLIMAYDDRLKDKNEVIRVYEAQLASFKARMLEIIRENQKLHMISNELATENDYVDLHEWNMLQEQAKLVVEENAILMQEMDLKDRRIDEIQDDYDIQVDKLTKKLRLFENESRNARTNVSSLQIDNEVLKKRCNELDTELAQRITEEDFEKSMKKVESPLIEKIEQHEKDRNEFQTLLQAVIKEKQELAVRLTDANGRSSQLQLEHDLAAKSLRKLERRYNVLQKKLEASQEKEFIATEALNQVLTVAEKNSDERDEFAKMVEIRHNETIIGYQQKMEDERMISVLQKELQKYKKLADKNSIEVQRRLNEKDEEIENLRNLFHAEVSNLKEIIRDRQSMVDRFQADEREFENEIDVLCKSVTEENEELRRSLTKS